MEVENRKFPKEIHNRKYQIGYEMKGTVFGLLVMILIGEGIVRSQ